MRNPLILVGYAALELSLIGLRIACVEFWHNILGMQRKRLHGTRVLVTAAGQGIGRAIALAFAAKGVSVLATDINKASLQDLAKAEAQIHTRFLDVRDFAAVRALADELGPLEVLCNCAGFVHHGTILECSEIDWDFSMDLNVKSVYRTCQAFLPGMLEVGKGSIINVASVVSSIKSAPKRFVYAGTKAAVIGLTKAIAADFVRQGIRCNAICPGTVQSPSLDRRIATQNDPSTARNELLARQPMGRFGRPEEIAALAVYLGSNESSFTTGQAYVIDGGWTA